MSDYIENEPTLKRIKLSVEKLEPGIDYISKIPDNVITHILTKLTTKEAVQTCVLSKGWENHWKSVPNLNANSKHFQKAEFFKKFVSKFLKKRDNDINLTNVDFQHVGYVRTPHVDEVINYVVSHGVENLIVNCFTNREIPKFHLFIGSNKLSCNTLKHLELSFQYSHNTILLPIKMKFPKLIECRLRNVTIQPMEKENGDDDCAEPFAECKKLTTLSIKDCAMKNGGKCLIVDGDNLSDVSICYKIVWGTSTFKVQMRTPNLTSFTYKRPIIRGHDLVFKNNLTFLQDVSMEVCSQPSDFVYFAPSVSKWLKLFTNSHSLAVSNATLKILTNLAGFPNVEPLNLTNLRTLTLKFDLKLHHRIPFCIVKYIIQNSPMVSVNIDTGFAPVLFDIMKYISKYNDSGGEDDDEE